MTEFTKSSGNVYADLQDVDAKAMHIKAQLASEIADIIRRRRLTQQNAAQIVGLPQPKLSEMLRGNFRGISEVKMIECLNRLGRDVEIVVHKISRRQSSGTTQVVFA